MQPEQTVENEVDDMIPIIFLNKTRKGINMCLKGIEDSYDMFCFCLDLFTKGLILLYSKNNEKLNLHTLTLDQLKYAISQLKKANIKVIVDTEILINPSASIKIPTKNPDNELEDYHVVIDMMDRRHNISFSLERYIHE